MGALRGAKDLGGGPPSSCGTRPERAERSEAKRATAHAFCRRRRPIPDTWLRTFLREQPLLLTHPLALSYTWCPFVVINTRSAICLTGGLEVAFQTLPAPADVPGTWLQSRAAARGALRTTWFVATHCFRQPLPGRRLRLLVFYAASGTSPDRSDRESPAPTDSPKRRTTSPDARGPDYR